MPPKKLKGNDKEDKSKEEPLTPKNDSTKVILETSITKQLKLQFKDDAAKMNKILKAMELPGFCNGGKESIKLPKTVLLILEIIQAKGNLKGLDEQFVLLSKYLENIHQILDECTMSLTNEESFSTAFEEKFGDKWAFKSSKNNNLPIWNKISEIKESVEAQEFALNELNTNFKNIQAKLTLISLSQDDLLNNFKHSIEKSTALEKLRQLLSDLEGIRAKRSVLIRKLDETDKEQTTLSQESPLSSINIDSSIKKMETKSKNLQQDLIENFDHQRDILKTVEEQYKLFMEERKQNSLNCEFMEEAEIFLEISGKLEEAMEFCEHLNKMIPKFSKNITHLCSERKQAKLAFSDKLQNPTTSSVLQSAEPNESIDDILKMEVVAKTEERMKIFFQSSKSSVYELLLTKFDQGDLGWIDNSMKTFGSRFRVDVDNCIVYEFKSQNSAQQAMKFLNEKNMCASVKNENLTLL